MNPNQKFNQKMTHLKQNSIYLLPNSFTIAALFSAFYAIYRIRFMGRFDTAAVAIFVF